MCQCKQTVFITGRVIRETVEASLEWEGGGNQRHRIVQSRITHNLYRPSSSGLANAMRADLAERWRCFPSGSDVFLLDVTITGFVRIAYSLRHFGGRLNWRE